MTGVLFYTEKVKKNKRADAVLCWQDAGHTGAPTPRWGGCNGATPQGSKTMAHLTGVQDVLTLMCKGPCARHSGQLE